MIRSNTTHIIVHHSATSPQATREEIRDFHIRERGWDDIGYHWIVLPSGAVLSGREESLEGAHCRGMNNNSIGVCVVGNYEETPLPEAARNALTRKLIDIARRFNIQPTNIIGHSEAALLGSDTPSTKCPGYHLASLLPEIRSEVRAGLSEEQSAAVCPPKSSIGLVRIDDFPGEGRTPDDYDIRVTPQGTLQRKGPSPHRDGIASPARMISILVERNLDSERREPVPPEPRQMTTIISLVREIREAHSLNEESIQGSIKDLGNILLRSRPFKTPVGAQSCSFSVRDTEIAHRSPFLITVAGKIRNTSQSLWSNFIDPEHPVRIGIMVTAVAQEERGSLFEDRLSLPFGYLRPGDEAPFRFEINPLSLPEGTVDIVIGVVKERAYWFHQHGGHAFVHRLSVSHPKIRPPEKRPLPPLAAHPFPILFITPSVPRHDRDSGGKRVCSLIEDLCSFGFPVTLAFGASNTSLEDEGYVDSLRALGVQIEEHPLSFLSSVKSDAYGICILFWHETAQRYLEVIRHNLPDAKVIIDTIDLHWIREERGVKAGLLDLSREELSSRKSSEIESYSRSDEIWVVSHEERLSLEQEGIETPIRVMPLSYNVDSFHLSTLTENSVVFVGSFAHPPNIDGALRAAHIMRLVRQKSGDPWRLLIVGANPPPNIRALHDGDEIIVTGFVSELSTVFAHARGFFSPLSYGGGVKGKNLEAALFGVPIVTTPVGNEGINLTPDIECLVSDTDEALATKFLSLVNTEGAERAMRDAARSRVASWHSHEARQDVLRASVLSRPVCVIIVTYNKVDLLNQCLTSLFKNTRHSDFCVAVVSNGCSDGTLDMLLDHKKRLGEALIINSLGENRHFVTPNNQVIKQFPNRDIVLLNNDVVIIDPFWLSELQFAAYQSPDTGAAGPLIIGPDGKVLEMGGVILGDGEARHLLRATDPVQIPRQLRSVGFVSGCCLYMRRDMIRRFGPLDESYSPMYYEDVEWQYRLHSHGIRSVVTTRTAVIHHEGSSAGTDTTQGFKRFQEINRRRFVSQYSVHSLERLGSLL